MNKKRPILIAVAMDCEMNILIEKLENKVLIKENVYDICEGEINNYPVVILKTKIGIINSATSLTLAIQKYNPIAIINEGTAGSHKQEYHTCDLIIGESIVNINIIKTDYKKAGEGTLPFDWKIGEFNSKNDEIVVYELDKNMLEIATNIKEKYKYGKVFVGRIGSGDIWNREVDRINWISSNLNTSCEEMEGIALTIVAHNFNIPIICFKVISNNEIIGEKFERSTAESCQEFTYMFIKEYIENLKKTIK